MAIIIKEIIVKTTIERQEQRIVSEEMIQKLKAQIINELGLNKKNHNPIKKVR